MDIAIYLGCAAFAIPTALWSEFYGYRIWGNFASVAYVFGAAHAIFLLTSARGGRLRSRWIPVGVVGGVGMVAPLVVLVLRRLTGSDWVIRPFQWAAQPEVWVIERSAQLLFDTGTPYVDIAALPRPPEVNDYTPYGPAMTVFGFPRALLGSGAITDARIMFALVTLVTIMISLRLLGRPRVPVRAAHLAVVSPLTALTFAVAGPDLAIIGLIVLAGALAVRGKSLWCAAVLAVVVSMKLSALPAVVVIIFYVVTTRAGRTSLLGFGTAIIGVTALLNVPVLIVHPGAFVEHVIKFPSGTGMITSPAASPLPGHLIASTGQVGHVVALVLLGLIALALTIWLFVRPPATGSATMLKAAIGLGAAILMVPASRYGYLVYPLVLWGAAMTFAVAERAASRSAEPRDVDTVPAR
ncbi:glycosyltransferase 87 family protein [Kibdelosporangium persicum]